MYSYLFFALSASYITQAKIEASLPSLGLCDSHGLDSLFNPICSGVRGSSTSPELQWLDERPGLQNSRRPAEQVTVSTHPVNKHPEWSHKPRCITQENSTKAYCAYTSHQFARGRGISIWDTPENIERVLALPAFTNQNVFDGVNEEPNPPYLAKELPGRGIGLIANRTLHRGDRIFSNTPVLLINQEASKTFVLEDRLPIQHTATQRLPQKARSAFLALCGHFGGDHIEDVLNTNSFAVDMKIPNSGHEYSAVFPEISRLNHDCRPNCHYYFNPKTLTHSVVALRTIHPGEELTISYIDPVQSHSQRQDALHSSWGFHCSCPACSSPPSQIAASDARIGEIVTLGSELTNYEESSEACPAMAEELVRLYEREGLWGPIAEAYALAAVEYSGWADPWNAMRFARLAVEAGELYGGPGDEDVGVMRRLLGDPWGHWSVGLRVGRRDGKGRERVRRRER